MQQKNKNTNTKPKNITRKPANVIRKHEKVFHKSSWYAIFFIFILAITLYVNTYHNRYALDDLITIQQNRFTQQGFNGIKDILTNDYFSGAFGKDIKHLPGARYRPLSVITFAIEYHYFGMNSHVSHLINFLLYALTGIFIYMVISLLLFPISELNSKIVNLKSKIVNTKWYLSIPFIAAVLFIAHPVHTEIVANIKGRDEIFAFLGSLIALYYSLKYIDYKSKKYLFYAFIAMFLSLMSKENAICFIAIIPLAIYFFRKVSIGKDIVSAIPLILAGILFLVIRQVVVGKQVTGTQTELMNNPFLYATTSQKYATIVYTLGLYIKLLIFPHPLTYDYYPYYIPLLNWNDYRVIISLLIYAGLIVFLIIALNKLIKLKYPAINIHYSILTFCILFYIFPLLLTSNLFFTIGVFMSERFVYMSSLGFCFAVAYGVQRLMFKVQSLKFFILILMSCVLILFSYKTIDRNKAWEDALTLYLTDVQTSYNSAKSNYDAANTLTQTADTLRDISLKNHYYDMAIKYALKAYKIHPVYADNLLTLGNVYYFYKKNFDSVMYYYRKQLQGFPDDNRPINNILHFFTNYNNIDYKIKAFKELLSLRPYDFDLNNNLGYLFGKYKNNPDSGIYYLSKAIEINDKAPIANPSIYDTYNNLGTWLYMKRDLVKAKDYYLMATNLKPDNPLFITNLGLVYRDLGDVNKAQECFNKANILNTKVNKTN